MADGHMKLFPDVISRVLEYLSPGPKPDQDDFYAIFAERKLRRHTLAMCARVCSVFSVPALDVLWRVVDDVSHLLRIFPSYQWVEGVFTQVITQTEWERFQAYAARVREIHIIRDYSYGLRGLPQDSAWMVLLQRSRGSHLLPHLTTISTGPALGVLMTLLGPTVIHLDLAYPWGSSENPPSADLALSLVEPHIPHLRSLKLFLRRFPGFRRLCHLQELHIMNTVDLTVTMVQELAKFPVLQRLFIAFKLDPSERTALAETNIGPGFFALRELHMEGSTFEDITAFLAASEPPGLDTISFIKGVNTRQEGPAIILDGLADAYARIPPHIRRFRLKIYIQGSYHWHESQIPRLTLARLLPNTLRTLPELRELSVTLRFEFGMEDDDLAGLCSRWPHLERFEIEAPAREGINHPTFSTLLDFARTHPGLTRLALPVLSSHGIPAVGESSAFVHRRLRLFNLGALLQGTPVVRLALALDSAFPELELGYASTAQSDQSMDREELPNVLMLLLLALQTARKTPGSLSAGSVVTATQSVNEI